ncbi:hypothetical protein ACFQZK_02040 [Rhodococcus aetherivorans]
MDNSLESPAPVESEGLVVGREQHRPGHSRGAGELGGEGAVTGPVEEPEDQRSGLDVDPVDVSATLRIERPAGVIFDGGTVDQCTVTTCSSVAKRSGRSRNCSGSTVVAPSVTGRRSTATRPRTTAGSVKTIRTAPMVANTAALAVSALVTSSRTCCDAPAIMIVVRVVELGKLGVCGAVMATFLLEVRTGAGPPVLLPFWQGECGPA